MREILFRGKCKTDNKWLYGFPYVTRKNAVKINWYCSEFGSMKTDEVDPETVGQYTGLTDKNGKRIFEGDIVRAFTRFSEIYVSSVAYHDGIFWFKNWSWTKFLFKFEKIEVIGNIHDNPELLETAAKPADKNIAQSGLAPATENFELMDG